MTAPVKFTAAAKTKTGNQRLCDAVTSSAVNGPHKIPGMVAYQTVSSVIHIDGTQKYFSQVTEIIKIISCTVKNAIYNC